MKDKQNNVIWYLLLNVSYRHPNELERYDTAYSTENITRGIIRNARLVAIVSLEDTHCRFSMRTMNRTWSGVLQSSSETKM